MTAKSVTGRVLLICIVGLIGAGLLLSDDMTAIRYLLCVLIFIKIVEVVCVSGIDDTLKYFKSTSEKFNREG